MLPYHTIPYHTVTQARAEGRAFLLAPVALRDETRGGEVSTPGTCCYYVHYTVTIMMIIVSMIVIVITILSIV